MAFLCIDIGGTNTILGAGNGDFETVAKYKTSDFIKDVSGKVNQALEDTHLNKKDIEQTAVAAAGPIDREKMVFYPPNISEEIGMGKINLGKALDDFGDIMIINDCTSAVLGEYHYGDHDSENLIYVTISSGIGAGAVLNGNLIQGANGNFAEVGHMQIENSLECGCGGKGHWEAYSSGENLPRMAKTLFDLEYKNAREIFDKSKKEDLEASKVIKKMQEVNKRAVANITTMYNPDKIVFGGAVALNHPEKVIGNLEDEIEDLTVNEVPEISICSLDEKAVIHGLRAVCNGEYKE